MQIHLICFLAILSLGRSQINYEVCTTIKHIEACQQIDRTDNIKCELSMNKAGCLLMINNGEASFGTFTPEEAFLATQLTENLTVVGEFVRESNRDLASFETVVVVKNTVDVTDGALKGLKGYKYCHPGFETTDLNAFILKEFETQALKENGLNECDAGIETITENYIKALEGFFGPSCRPGKWVQNIEFDKQLKAKYPKLTELCNITAYSANTNDPFKQSLDCLLSGRGEVALTTREKVNELIFNNAIDVNSYRFICREGNTATMDKICAWTRQPWNLLLANKNVVSNLKVDLLNWFGDSILNSNLYSLGSPKLDAKYEVHLKTIMFPYVQGFRLNITESKLVDYMKDFRALPTLDNSKLCKTELKWCTISSNEQRKCKWFSQASLNYGIQPVINCVQKTNKLECIDAIYTNGADIVTIEADLGFPAIRKNLSAIAFPETKKEMEVYSLIVVTGGINRLENLKNKRSCFNQYGSMAWVSFIDAARHVVLPSDSCDYGKLISDFVSNSCIPGAKNPAYGKSNHIDEEKLCKCLSDVTSETAANCNAESTNLYFGNNGALRCLSDGEGDFAVISKSGVLLDDINTNFTVLCKNGTLANYPGLDVDEDCYLSVATTSSIVTRRGDAMNRDIALALLEFDERFAVEIHSPFKLFDDFYGTKDLLFKDSTPGLDMPNSNVKDIKNYVNIFKHIDDCVATGKDGSSRVSTISLVWLIVCSVLTKLIL